jgi:hypothetical protein
MPSILTGGDVSFASGDTLSLMQKPVRRQSGRFGELWPWVFLLTLSSLFFFSYFNRFAGLRSGDGAFGGGVALLAGRLPYRDYYTAGPPLNQIKSAVELSLFGKTLLVSRLCAVLERLVIAALLYAWLRRLFRSWAAAIAALATIILSAADHTDPLASYNHDAILFAMLCGLLTSFCFGETQNSPWGVETRHAGGLRAMLVLGALAGASAGLSALTKQTVGLGVAVAVLILGSIAIGRLRGAAAAFPWGLAYLAGFAAPLLAIGAWLHRIGVLRAALIMMFVSGPSAKAAGSHAFLRREFSVAADNPAWLIPALIAIVVSARPIWRAVGGEDRRGSSKYRWSLLWLCAVAVIGCAELLAYTRVPSVHDVSKCAVYFTLLGTSWLGAAAVIRGFRGRGPDIRIWQIALFAGVGFSVAVTLSLSWPVFEAMALPGLGLLLAAVLDGSKGWGRAFVYLVLAVVVFLTVHEKLDLPFSFDHQDEAPVRLATVRSNQPMLRGMRLPAQAVHMLDETAALMRAQPPGATVFTYPEMGLFYPLSGRLPPTRAGSHNIDVVSDTLARQDAERLLQAPPSLILYGRPTEGDLRAEEAIWRNGRPSGQRDMIAALDALVANYRLVDTFCLYPGDIPMRLYVRLSK